MVARCRVLVARTQTLSEYLRIDSEKLHVPESDRKTWSVDELLHLLSFHEMDSVSLSDNKEGLGDLGRCTRWQARDESFRSYMESDCTEPYTRELVV